MGKNNGGSEKASVYTYTGTKDSCRFSSSFVGARVASYANVDASESAMMTALQNGPLAVAINAVDSLSYYKSGVYSGNCRSSQPRRRRRRLRISQRKSLLGRP